MPKKKTAGIDGSKSASRYLADLRQRAEKKFRTAEAQAEKKLTPEAMRRLLHELRVHQIELEMQNDELRLAQDALETARARYFDLYDLAPVGYVTVSEAGQILEANLTAAMLLGTMRGELVRQTFSRFINKEHQDIYYRCRKGLFATQEPQEFDLLMVKKDGSVFWVHLAAAIAPDSAGARMCRIVISDIGKRKQAESDKMAALEALAQQNDALSKLKNFSIGLSTLTAEDNLEAFITKRIKEFTGAKAALFSEYNPANQTTTPHYVEMDRGLLEKTVSLLGKQVETIQSVVSAEMYQEMTSEIIGIRRTLHEASFGAVSRPVAAAIQALLKVDRFIGLAYLIEGKLYGTSLLAMSKDQPDPPKEILEYFSFLAALPLRRKQAESQKEAVLEALRDSLAGKEVLLKEVHHRVKNNLAAISGLLQMQHETTTDPAALALFQELEGRIHSMALVHETLYSSESLDRIDIQDYLEKLIAKLRAAMAPDRNVCISVAAAGVEMGLDCAIPCGLILNELLTNAFKYAFPGSQLRAGEKACKITVTAARDGAAGDDGVYTLTVADNGVGLPVDLDWATTKTLGLRLVRMLGQFQLNGQVELDRSRGTSFRLVFAPRPREKG